MIFMQLSYVYSVQVSDRWHALNECFKIQVLQIETFNVRTNSD